MLQHRIAHQKRQRTPLVPALARARANDV